MGSKCIALRRSRPLSGSSWEVGLFLHRRSLLLNDQRGGWSSISKNANPRVAGFKLREGRVEGGAGLVGCDGPE